MLPGYLHFNVRRGLRSDMLNAAMASLLRNHDAVKNDFNALGLDEITFTIEQDGIRGIKGKSVHFYANDLRISLDQSLTLFAPKLPKNSVSPIWHRSAVQKISEDQLPLTSTKVKNKFLYSCLNQEAQTISSLKELFRNDQLKPCTSALALKILDELECSIFIDQKISGMDALWLLCHLLMLCSQIDALDPKFISSTKVSLGESETKERASTIVLSDRLWLNQVLATVPMIEVDDFIGIDVLAVAFLKTLTGQFGPRGDSTILEIGIGISSQTLSDGHAGFVEALWCEAKLPWSMSEQALSQDPRLCFIHHIRGKVLINQDMLALSTALTLAGALSISWHLVYGENNLAHYAFEFFANDHDKRSLIEMFLIQGGAKEVAVTAVEQHALAKRLVAVPVGTGNKASSVRLHEFIYHAKIVRVEPVLEDLEEYASKTGFSVDVARSDLLMAWKKWRGRFTEES